MMLEMGNGYAVVGGGMVRSSNEIRRESCCSQVRVLDHNYQRENWFINSRLPDVRIRSGGAKQLIPGCKTISTTNSSQSHHSSYETKTT
jgi:hypothetical protein